MGLTLGLGGAASGCRGEPTAASIKRPVEVDDAKPDGSSVFQMVTGEDAEEGRNHWDSLYRTTSYIYGKEPAVFLRDNVQRLPVGRVLDVAMGEGRNAVFLAKKGFSVDGVDYSEVALRKARRLAKEHHVSVNTINADLTRYLIRPEHYEVIVNIDFLMRPLVAQIKKGLKHGGMVVFENATVDFLNLPDGKNTPKDYLLEKGELRELFKDFEVIEYHEINDGKRAVASLIARKP